MFRDKDNAQVSPNVNSPKNRKIKMVYHKCPGLHSAENIISYPTRQGVYHTESYPESSSRVSTRGLANSPSNNCKKLKHDSSVFPVPNTRMQVGDSLDKRYKTQEQQRYSTKGTTDLDKQMMIKDQESVQMKQNNSLLKLQQSSDDNSSSQENTVMVRKHSPYGPEKLYQNVDSMQINFTPFNESKNTSEDNSVSRKQIVYQSYEVTSNNSRESVDKQSQGKNRIKKIYMKGSNAFVAISDQNPASMAGSTSQAQTLLPRSAAPKFRLQTAHRQEQPSNFNLNIVNKRGKTAKLRPANPTTYRGRNHYVGQTAPSLRSAVSSQKIFELPHRKDLVYNMSNVAHPNKSVIKTHLSVVDKIINAPSSSSQAPLRACLLKFKNKQSCTSSKQQGNVGAEHLQAIQYLNMKNKLILSGDTERLRLEKPALTSKFTQSQKPL